MNLETQDEPWLAQLTRFKNDGTLLTVVEETPHEGYQNRHIEFGDSPGGYVNVLDHQRVAFATDDKVIFYHDKNPERQHQLTKFQADADPDSINFRWPSGLLVVVFPWCPSE